MAAVDFFVKDLALAAQGKRNLDWAEQQMPVLLKIRERFAKEKPLKGVKIGACLHVTKETGVLMRTLIAGGAEVRLCASNPLSTQDDVAAALASEGIPTFAVKGMGPDDYYKCLNSCLDLSPNITLDDGADLINAIHTKRTELLPQVFAGQEETTTGVIRLRAMANEGALKYPVIAVNDTPTKHLFDNVYGTGQSTIDGLLRATNVLLAGRTFVVVGYGHCGKGVAKRAAGMGAKVVVVEVDAVEALRGHLDGFDVMTMAEAAKVGDIFVTVTGNKNVIRQEHFGMMKDGAIVANTGHFNVEIDLPALEKLAVKREKVRPFMEKFQMEDGRRIYLLGDGRLINLAAAEGHPSAVMDLSFADQALVAEHIAKNRGNLGRGVLEVPKEIDGQVAKLKLEAEGVGLEVLTQEQIAYLQEWREGT
ncbi:adenosylhomocysteinase [Candidatus Micrarchaeota archaeon]|nr:adenosylhomocysteinase [Candidatus Micrarchaeota archaeon]MBI5177529.1 adenosylhomocysteinase [Candidatus Micrarchaeota archaeon]